LDSLSQIVLGAAVGEAILGRKLGNKALLLGAIGGTLPDLDVIYNFFDSDPVAHIRVHRAWSHAIFVHLFASLPLAWLGNRIISREVTVKKWYSFWSLVLITHAVLDSLTTYGTRLFLPFTDYQVAFNNISVIDPLYTLPFLLLLSVCLFLKKGSIQRERFLKLSLFVSSIYLLFTFGLKYKVHALFSDSLKAENISYSELNTTPTILNSVLWSAVAWNETELYIAEYSFLKKDDKINWIKYERKLHLLEPFSGRDFETVKWFSDGSYFAAQDRDGKVGFFSVKFGRINFETTNPEEAFFFFWNIVNENGTTVIRQNSRRRTEGDMKEAFNMLFRRIGL